MNLQKVAYFFISIISIVVILNIGSSLIIPFIFAALLWFIVRQLRLLMEKIPFIKGKFPKWLKNLIAFTIIFVIVELALNVFISNVNQLANSYTKYEINALVLINQINETFNINILDKLKIYIADFDIGSFLISAFKASTDIISTIFMVLVYSLFIFLEESSFHSKLKKMFDSDEQFEKTKMFIINIENSVGQYIGVKSLTSFATGIISYIILLIIGIDYPAFWAFIIFLLNYVPAIGSTVATLFPALFSLLQFGDFMPALMIIIFVGAVQLLIGNVIEPKLMGSTMNISPLVTILALSFWGAIWGLTGMILSVPIMVIIVIILSQFEQTRPIAVMLSEKGNIKSQKKVMQ